MKFACLLQLERSFGAAKRQSSFDLALSSLQLELSSHLYENNYTGIYRSLSIEENVCILPFLSVKAKKKSNVRY